MTRQHGRVNNFQSGFTIVELMIATVVFSVVLLVITTGVIHITQMYYKGVALTKTQNTARAVMDTIAQSIQFSGGQVSWPANSPATGHGCVGDQSYDFQLGYKIDPAASSTDTIEHSAHAIEVGSDPNCSSSASFSPGTTELLAPHMRLTSLDVSQYGASTDRLWNVSVTVAYGDYDLFCNRSLNGQVGGCDHAPFQRVSDIPSHFWDSNVACRSGAGSEYCAVSSLSTVVQQRLTQ